MIDIKELYVFIVTFSTTFFSTISGGGTGLVLLPVYLLIFDGPFKEAQAMNKLALTALVIGALIRYKKENLIEWKYFFWIFFTGMPTSIFGTYLIHMLPAEALMKIVGILILAFILFSLLRQKNQDNNAVADGLNMNGKSSYATIILCIVGVYAGVISASYGTFIVLLLRWIGFSQKQSVALAMTAGAGWSVHSMLTHMYLGDYSGLIQFIPVIVSGAFLGGNLGAKIVSKAPNNILKYIFFTLASTSGLCLVMK